MENSTVQICERCREANAANHIRGTDETGTWLFCKRCGSITRFREGLNENQLLHKAACQSGAVALTNYKFDDAYTQFETALKRCPNSAEAVWGMICCDYGIVMVRDFYEGAYKPIYCYADYANVEPFDRNANVVRLRLLCGENETVRAVYWEWMEKCAKDLKRIAEEIRKAPEYDVFICCKISTKTDDHPDWPGRTDEADEARTLYDDLTRRGVKVFYSEKNIKDGIEFDWQILRAMLKSRCMLIVCGSENSYEFLESQWVKSEWKRWLRLCEKGIKERSSVCLFSINTTSFTELPFEFNHLGVQVIKPGDREKMLLNFERKSTEDSANKKGTNPKGEGQNHKNQPEVKKPVSKGPSKPKSQPKKKLKRRQKVGVVLSQTFASTIGFMQKIPVKAVILVALALVLIGTVVALSIYSWKIGQWVIGIILAITIILGTVLVYDREDCYLPQLGVVAGISVMNLVLLCLFPDNCSNMALAIAVGSAIAMGIGAYYAYDDCESGIGTSAVVGLFLNLIFAAFIPEWQTGQWLLGFFLAFAIVAVTVLRYLVEDCYLLQLGVVAGISIVNLIIAGLIPENFSNAAMLIALGSAIAIGCCAVFAYEDVEEGFGMMAVVIMAINLAVATSVKGGLGSFFLWFFVYLIPAALIAEAIVLILDNTDTLSGGLAVSITAIVILTAHIILVCACPHFVHTFHDYPEILSNEYGENQAICYCGEEIELNDFSKEWIHSVFCEHLQSLNIAKNMESLKFICVDEMQHRPECKCGFQYKYETHRFENGICVNCQYQEGDPIVFTGTP